MAFGVRRAVRCYEGVFRKQVVTLPQKWICSKHLHSSTLMKDHEGISSTFFDYIDSGLQPCKDKSAKVSTRLHTSSPKLTAPRPVAWLLFDNKTMLSSDENRIRSEEQPPQRLALLVAPFWGIAPWKVEAGKQGWRSAFGVLWDAMKECSGNKLSHFRRNESAQNTYTHLHSWRIMKESLRHSSTTFIVGCSPARTRVQRYQQGCTLVHQNSQHRDLWRDCSSITRQCCQVMKTESGPRSNRLNVWHCWWRLFGELLLGRLRQASKDGVRRSACCEMLWRSVQETSCHTSAEMNLLKTPTFIYTHEGSWRNLFDILRLHL